jgi:hypothetical protein
MKKKLKKYKLKKKSEKNTITINNILQGGRMKFQILFRIFFLNVSHNLFISVKQFQVLTIIVYLVDVME